MPLFDGQSKRYLIVLASSRCRWLLEGRAMISRYSFSTSHGRHGWKAIITLLTVSGVSKHSCNRKIPARSMTSCQTGRGDIPVCAEQAKLDASHTGTEAGVYLEGPALFGSFGTGTCELHPRQDVMQLACPSFKKQVCHKRQLSPVLRPTSSGIHSWIS